MKLIRLFNVLIIIATTAYALYYFREHASEPLVWFTIILIYVAAAIMTAVLWFITRSIK